MKQETNIKINIGDKGKGKRKYARRQPKKESQSQQSQQPSYNITISNPPAVSTIQQLPIYYQQKQEPSPFLANSEPTIQVPESQRQVGNQIPIKYKNIPVDPTQLSGQVPASFIPEEAPALVKTGGELSSLTRELTTYTPPQSGAEVGGAYLTEVEAVAVKPRKKYEFKPETLARREERRRQREQMGLPTQNTPPNPETTPLSMINPMGLPNRELLNKTAIALEKYSQANQARTQQGDVIQQMRLQEASVKNRTMKNRQLSQSPSAIYQRERRQKLKNEKK